MNLWWERHPRLVDGLAVAFWAILIGGSLLLALGVMRKEVDRVAYERARVLFEVVETTRLWNARHGGLYAPVSDSTPPNPYLIDVKRDVEINGVPYTKVNPAYMTRQISEMVKSEQGLWFSITSLRPLNPGNVPDAWEGAVLKRFEGGETEVLELTEDGDGARFRYMAALFVKPECLHCHAVQNYAVGDVRGGLSVSLPAKTVFGDFALHRAQMIGLHGVAFLLLAGGSLVFLAHIRRNWAKLAAAKAEQEAIVADRTAELRAANVALQRSNAELETFAYAISHDLQEPLRMMGGYAGLLKRRYDGQLDAEGQEFLGYMTDGAVRMRGMIADLLAYSRVDRQALEPRPLSLEDACAAALANLGVAMEEAGAAVTTNLGGVDVLGDRSQIARVFQNLIVNAIKYAHPDRPPRITVGVRPAEGAMVEVSVADNGLGVPADARERVFGIFQRLRQNASSGSGMGLALSRRIIERHGGTIWVDGVDGGGSVFRFTLPARPDEP